MFRFKFDWDSRLELSIPHIDEQHQQLFRIGRSIEQYLLFQCIGVASEDLLKILYELRDYVTYHFYDEEKFMREIHFPEIENHIKAHNEFTAYINKIDYAKLCEDPNASLYDLKEVLTTWIFQHLIHEDLKFSAYLQSLSQE